MAEFTEEDEGGYHPISLGARPNTGAYVNSKGRHTGPTLLTGEQLFDTINFVPI